MGTLLHLSSSSLHHEGVWDKIPGASRMDLAQSSNKVRMFPSLTTRCHLRSFCAVVGLMLSKVTSGLVSARRSYRYLLGYAPQECQSHSCSQTCRCKAFLWSLNVTLLVVLVPLSDSTSRKQLPGDLCILLYNFSSSFVTGHSTSYLKWQHDHNMNHDISWEK